MTLNEPAFSDPFQPVSNYRNSAQHIDFMSANQAQASQPIIV
jgi:hypothetical protein